MTAYTVTRGWYGPKGYQHYWKYTSPTSGTLPAIVYCPGGGWAGAQREAFETEEFWRYGLNNQDNATYLHDYDVYVINTASYTYTANGQYTEAAWANTTLYAVGDEVHRAGLRYQCRTAHTSVAATDEPAVGSGWTDVWHLMSRGMLAWVDATAYTEDTQVSHAGARYQCIRAHTASAASDEPGVPAGWDETWREIGVNEAMFRLSVDRAETTPGYLDESVTNVQQFMGWLKRNATAQGTDPDKIILAGNSAGGQRAGCAAYMYDLPYAFDGTPYAASQQVARLGSRPRAVYLNITPVDFRLHTIANLSNRLYGRDLTDGDFTGFANVERDAVSPMRILKRTGLAVPTYLNYIGTRHDDTVAATVWSTGFSPYHHALNGWLMLKALTDTRANDGLAKTTGNRFIETSATTNNFQVYTDYNGTATNVPYTVAGLTAANDFLAWAAATLV